MRQKLEFSVDSECVNCEGTGKADFQIDDGFGMPHVIPTICDCVMTVQENKGSLCGISGCEEIGLDESQFCEGHK